ncbi:hypothetical protein HEMROJRC1_01780 [Rodentibacter sp. JRC1]|nr:hypothetical protein HEMROJRC1_01780 [Rodentibacter sp. JRC1]
MYRIYIPHFIVQDCNYSIVYQISLRENNINDELFADYTEIIRITGTPFDVKRTNWCKITSSYLPALP